MERSYHSIRKQYRRGVLRENQVDADPLVQLGIWLSEAIKAEVPEPTAMVLSTTGMDLRPSSRVVLMKDLNPGGITFFTNYESRKGNQLAENCHASLLFFWPVLERQVRIEGDVLKVTETESDDYFYSRPVASRISATISPQSLEIPGREWLEEKWQEATGRHHPISGTEPLKGASRPPHWGGYRMAPVYAEFWQGREDRLHDRIFYRPDGGSWKIGRLAP